MLAADQGRRGPDRPGHARPERPLGSPDARAESRLTRLSRSIGVTRTVLITGGAGFIGSNLTRRLVRARRPGPDPRRPVDRPDRLPRRRAARARARLAGGCRTTVRSAVDGVDAIVHLAARAGIDDSVRDPLGTFEANVTWSVGLLEAARLAGVRRFVFASSNAAAGDHQPPSDETDLPHPISPYGASKLAIEAYCQAYAATFGLAACSLRFSNAYGPYSLHKRSVVAAWLRAALAGRPIEINGDGQQTRDFVHADDLAAAVEAVLDAPEDDVAGELFQAGTGRRDDRRRARRRDRAGGRAAARDPSRTGAGRRRRAERGARRQGRVGPRVSGGGRARRRAGRGPRPGSRRPSRTPLWPASRPTRRRAPSEREPPMTASAEAAVGSRPTPSGPLPSRRIPRAGRPSPLLRDAFVTIVTRFGLAILIFATDIALARLLGPSAKGRFALVLLYSQLAALIVGWGMDQALAVVAGRDRQTARQGMANAIVWTAVVGGIAVVLSRLWLYGVPAVGPAGRAADGPHPEPVGRAVHLRGAGAPGRAVLLDRAVRAAGAQAGRPVQPDPRRAARDPAGDDRGHRRDRPPQPRRRPGPQPGRPGRRPPILILWVAARDDSARVPAVVARLLAEELRFGDPVAARLARRAAPVPRRTPSSSTSSSASARPASTRSPAGSPRRCGTSRTRSAP